MVIHSSSTEEALSHLKKIKPLGGWNVEYKDNSNAVRLLRRKIPVTDSYFLDLHHDKQSGCIVGMLSKPSIVTGKAQGQVIVDEEGKPASMNKTQIITVASYDPSRSSGNSRTTTTPRSSTSNNSTTTRNNNNNNNNTTTTSALTPEENKQLLQYAMYAAAFAIFLRVLTQTMMTVSLLIVPIVYLYALQTCPTAESFDTKKELRRILRGHHLPDDHPNKPKNNIFSQTIARVGAAITTELATGLGYEVSMTSIAGAAWLANVKVPTSAQEFFFIGAFNRWTYVYVRNIEE